MENKEIDQLSLIETLDYNQQTGAFTWKKKRSNIEIGRSAGSTTRYGYIQISINGKLYLAHRLAWLYVYGKFPHAYIDHINGNKIDNSIGNLREASPSENMKNQFLNKNNSSGSCGVRWNKSRKKWQPRIVVNGKEKYLGLFLNYEDAVFARKQAESIYGYSPRHGQQKRIQ